MKKSKQHDHPVFGAIAPPDLAWQNNRPAATLKFVRDVQVLLQNDETVSSLDKGLLEEAVEQVKEGILNFSTWITPREYLELYKQS